MPLKNWLATMFSSKPSGIAEVDQECVFLRPEQLRKQKFLSGWQWWLKCGVFRAPYFLVPLLFVLFWTTAMYFQRVGYPGLSVFADRGLAALGNTFAMLWLAAVCLVTLLASSFLFLTFLGARLANAELFFPKSLIFEPEGLVLATSFGSRQTIRSKAIPYKDIAEVFSQDLVYQGQLETKTIEIVLSRVSLANRWKLQNVFISLTDPTLFLEPLSGKFPDLHGAAQLRIPLIGLASKEDFRNLGRALSKHLPKERLSGLDESVLTPDLSFTELWLHELQEQKSSSAQKLEAGHELAGKYRIKSVLGTGGFSIVYLAQPLSEPSSCPVAIKEFFLPKGAPATRDRALRQIACETETLQKLSHPGIVSFKETFTAGGRIYIVLDAIEGKNLCDTVTSGGALVESEIVDIAIQCCDILVYLHGLDPPLIHRDFTPDNLMISDNGVKLIDFNVAQWLEAASTKTVVGKHCFIAPEQFRGEPIQASDLYSLGATMFFLATGGEPEPLSQSHPREAVNGKFTSEFDAIVARCTALDTTDRFISAHQLKDALLELKAAQSGTAVLIGELPAQEKR